MRKCKAYEMQMSGKEKLDYDVCRRCNKERKLRVHHCGWSQMQEEEFGAMFIAAWEREAVLCPVTQHHRASPFEEPPEGCPYVLEHVVQVTAWREEAIDGSEREPIRTDHPSRDSSE